MFHAARKFAVWFAAALAAGGCARPEPPAPPITLDTRGMAPSPGVAELTQVLKQVVGQDGLVDTTALKAAQPTLETQLKRMAVTGPTATPRLYRTPEEALAYWYNALAGWSMELLLLEGCPCGPLGARQRSRRFPLDGRMMSLAEIGQLLARDEDFRTAVAAPGISPVDAHMPTTPFEAEDIREKVLERFGQFLADRERFLIDAARRQVLVPPVLWQFRERLIRSYHQTYHVTGATMGTALLPHVSGRALRRVQDAVGYRYVEATPDCLAEFHDQ